MGRLYADAAALHAYPGGADVVVDDRQLRSASLLVQRATRHAVYTVGGDGKATDPRVEAALRDATCEVLLHRNEAGVMSDVPAGLQSASIGSASYTLVPGALTGAYRNLPWDAYLILEDAGLTSGPVTIVG